MSDALYLSLWYPNLRLAELGDKLVSVLTEFSKHGGEPRVYAATVWPMSWAETPVFQRVWGRAEGAGVEPRIAVKEALELLHEDYAYEFQIGWHLWELVPEGVGKATADPSTPSLRSVAQDDTSNIDSGGVSDPRWVRAPRLVRVTGYGALFDEGAYEQDGHVRIDFGSDTPFLEEEAELNSVAALHMADNVRRLVELTKAVEKASGATARLLWSESGESLAQRLAERLGKGN